MNTNKATKSRQIISIVITFLLLIWGQSLWAETKPGTSNRINGICYYLYSETNTAEVTKSANPYTGDIYIPSTVTYDGKTYTVTSIDSWAFSEQNITSVSLPNTLYNIGSNAFYKCTNLQRVSLGNSLRAIGWCAFAYCTSLSSISIPNSVQVIEGSAFSGCSDLASIYLPENLTSIDYYVFKECTSLKEITIPQSVTKIVKYAFDGCTSLWSVTLPKSLKEFHVDAFSDCI